MASMLTSRQQRAANRAERKSPVRSANEQLRSSNERTPTSRGRHASSQAESLRNSADIYGRSNQRESRSRARSMASVSAPPSSVDDRHMDEVNAQDLDADEMEVALVDLDSFADRLLDEMLPEDTTDDFQASYFARDPKARKRFGYQSTAFRTTMNHYTGDKNYIQPGAVRRSMLNDSADVDVLDHVWRPDDILRKANLAQMLTDILLVQERPMIHILEDIENSFPKAVAGPVFDKKAFKIALALTTQVAIARLEVTELGFYQDIEGLVRDSFLVESGSAYRHWTDLGTDDLTPSLRRGLATSVTTRIQKLSAPFKKFDADRAIEELHKQHSWSDFKESLLSYCRDRRQQINAEIAGAGGAVAIQEACREVAGLVQPHTGDHSTVAKTAPAPSMQYASSGVALLKARRKKNPGAVVQKELPQVHEEEEDDEDDEDDDDLQGARRRRAYGQVAASTSSLPLKRPHEQMSSYYRNPPSIEPTQDEGPGRAQRPSSAIIPTQTTSQQGREREIALAFSSPQGSEKYNSVQAGLRALIKAQNIKGPNENLFHKNRKPPMKWTKAEEQRIHQIVESMSRTGVTAAGVKDIDDNISSKLPGHQPLLQNRKIQHIKDKLRLMKKDLLINSRPGVRPARAWESIYLPEKEVEAVLARGVDYDRELERERWTAYMKSLSSSDDEDDEDGEDDS